MHLTWGGTRRDATAKARGLEFTLKKFRSRWKGAARYFWRLTVTVARTGRVRAEGRYLHREWAVRRANEIARNAA
jgi:hypothetical protein